MALAFIEMTSAENFCNGIPLGSNSAGVVDYSSDEFKSRTNAEVYDVALTHIDSALAIVGSATDVVSTDVRRASLLTKARILVDKGQYAAAAALVPVSVIPNNYQYLFITQASTNNDNLGIWTLNNSIARMTVGDSIVNYLGKQFFIGNVIPFATLNDPRVPILKGTDAKLPAEDGGLTPLFIQQIWKGRDDPMVSGIDARLIEAEGKLAAGDFAGMMTILNALRTAPPRIGNFQPATMTAISTTPTTKRCSDDVVLPRKSLLAIWSRSTSERSPSARSPVRSVARQGFPSGAALQGRCVR